MSTKDTNMTIIEITKHNGAVKALHERIEYLLLRLTERNWTAIKRDNGTFCGLGDAITAAETTLDKIRETLEALQELEPHNK